MKASIAYRAPDLAPVAKKRAVWVVESPAGLILRAFVTKVAADMFVGDKPGNIVTRYVREE